MNFFAHMNMKSLAGGLDKGLGRLLSNKTVRAGAGIGLGLYAANRASNAYEETRSGRYGSGLMSAAMGVGAGFGAYRAFGGTNINMAALKNTFNGLRSRVAPGSIHVPNVGQGIHNAEAAMASRVGTPVAHSVHAPSPAIHYGSRGRSNFTPFAPPGQINGGVYSGLNPVGKTVGKGGMGPRYTHGFIGPSVPTPAQMSNTIAQKFEAASSRLTTQSQSSITQFEAGLASRQHLLTDRNRSVPVHGTESASERAARRKILGLRGR